VIAAPDIPGLSVQESDALAALLRKLDAVRRINATRSRYYDAKQVTRHLGISIPPQLESVETVIGWPEKAVSELEIRTDFDRFVLPGGDLESFGVNDIAAANRLRTESVLAHTSAYKYGPAFITSTRGDVASGEPDVLMRVMSAETTTALWDPNARRPVAGLTLVSQNSAGVADEFFLFLPGRTLAVKADSRGRWDVRVEDHGIPRPAISVMPFKPSTESPFGRSRISQAVMSITDRAVRSLLRMEVSAEFYSSPQRYVLGADESAFVGPNGEARTGWEAVLSKVLALGLNEDGDTPTVGQFPQLTMQPHMDMVRSDAALFAGETNIPVNALGIIHDNPASDAAMHTAFLSLDKTAERAADTFGAGLVDAMQVAVMLRDGLTELPKELRRLEAAYRDPSKPTRAAQVQNAVQLVAAGLIPADSDVALEMAGFDDITIQRIQADRRRSQVSQLVSGIQERMAAAQQDPTVQQVAEQR
jgi:hypothetical protein